MTKKVSKGLPLLKIFGRFLTISLLITLIAIGYKYRKGILFYLGLKSSVSKERTVYDIRNYEILDKYDQYACGIDISEYQGDIAWQEVKTIDNTFPISFVLVRATAGSNKVDDYFKVNFKKAQQQKFITGAYHYYRPDENSTQQAQIFIQNVRLRSGNLPPVLDIEKMPEQQSMQQLKKGLKNWLSLVQAHYKVKPIIYTSERFYIDFLKTDFQQYQFWIANYNFFVDDIRSDWAFWQFSERGKINGIDAYVDFNIYNGNVQQLKKLRIP